MPAISEGDRIAVIDRKLFRDDNTRIFVGVVQEVGQGVLSARGWAFHISPYEVTGVERRGEERLRLLSFSSNDIIYLLPRDQDISRLQLRRSPKSMTLTDGKFAMDLSDFMIRA
jgi:hypothetical protein